ncbi:hypothetical protein JXA88_05130 [Candidatus Fermentibacteria bacterium]|nr:hypothetical protein [Candidatus Fermentibacteria bacterium]
MKEAAGEAPRQEYFLADGERIYLGEEEIEEILGILEERVAEWLAQKKDELTEEEYHQIVIRFLEMVKLG